MSTRVFIAALISSIIAFFAGYLVFGILLRDFYTENTTSYAGLNKEPYEIWAIYLSNLVYAFLLAYIFNRWAKIWTAMEGFKAGVLISFCTGLSFDLFLYATMNLYTITLLPVDVILNSLFGGLEGAVAALVIGWGRNHAPTGTKM